MTERITDKLVKALKPPASGNRITYDTEVTGFGIRITAAGAKAFVLNYRTAGREHRFTIGSYPDWSVAAAREEAKTQKRRIDRGENPLTKRQEVRSAPTLADLWLEYEAKRLPKKRLRSAADDRSMWQTYILPKFRNVKVADLRVQDVEELHAEIGKDKPIRANRVVEVLRAALNMAIKWKWISENPASGIDRNPEEQRERRLTRAEITTFATALDSHPSPVAVAAIRLLMMTGARKSEVLAATWSQFDLDEGIWTKPSSHTKQKKTHRVPLSQAAIDLLLQIRAADWADPVHVFPGSGAAGHFVDLKRAWSAIVADAKLKDFRIHDLRHTYASVLASQRVPLQVVGALLGHTQAQTTARYTHFYDEPLKDAAEAFAQVVEKRRQP